jgi:hypothetical protein
MPMTAKLREWHFWYTRKGKRIKGYAWFSKPSRDSQRRNWFVIFQHDWDAAEHKLYGEDENQATQLATDFIRKLYDGFVLENENGTPFNWDP